VLSRNQNITNRITVHRNSRDLKRKDDDAAQIHFTKPIHNHYIKNTGGTTMSIQTNAPIALNVDMLLWKDSLDAHGKKYCQITIDETPPALYDIIPLAEEVFAHPRDGSPTLFIKDAKLNFKDVNVVLQFICAKEGIDNTDVKFEEFEDVVMQLKEPALSEILDHSAFIVWKQNLKSTPWRSIIHGGYLWIKRKAEARLNQLFCNLHEVKEELQL
jgi:hypothetical protein